MSETKKDSWPMLDTWRLCVRHMEAVVNMKGKLDYARHMEAVC